jgi:hypothetical protein
LAKGHLDQVGADTAERGILIMRESGITKRGRPRG